MKRLIIIACVLLPALLNAGVILKKSGQRLEDVSIKLVSDTEIIYTTLEGTETSIPKTEVSAVLYDDGRYEEIRQTTTQNTYDSDENAFAVRRKDELTREQQDSIWRAQAEAYALARQQKKQEADSVRRAKHEAYAATYELIKQQIDSVNRAKEEAKRLAAERKQFVADSIKQAKLEAERLAAERKQFVADSIKQAKQAEADRIKAMEPYFITRISNKEYILNGTQMNKKAYQQFLMKNCAEAYSLYAKGTREVKAGWALFSLGLITSAPWYFLNEYADVSDGWCYIGGALCASMILVSIPVMGAGYGHRKKSVNVYNQKCASPDNLLSLNFGATRNGLGLTLNW